ncbi:MAG: hypothetical protein AMXMBFR33_03930 [Candidatus Xenobia bacterium]
MSIGRQKGLLEHLLGVGRVVQHLEAKMVNPAGVTLDELLKGLVIAAGSLLDELVLGGESFWFDLHLQG